MGAVDDLEATVVPSGEGAATAPLGEAITVAAGPDPPAAGARLDLDGFPIGWARYQPIRLLGQGGMGRVFLARDLKLQREVAIKFVRNDDPELARRIVVEARAQARIRDERVCQVYDVGEVDGRIYIAMQAIAGRNLAELADELTYEQQALVMRGAALGVHEAHKAGLVHRDLKPSNIMVERGADGELRPYVMDFGLARDRADSNTMTGTVMGTPQYMSPEQARGEVKQLDRRADVYSLGATLYALVTGRPPIDGANQLVILNRIALDEPVRPRAVDADVPADLDAIVMKCLEKERAARYDSARALADDLGRFLDGAPVAARASAGLGYRLRRFLRRRWRLVAVASLMITALAIATGFGLRERWAAARRETLARRFTEQVERIEARARYATLSPPHDLTAERAELRRLMDVLAAEIRSAGGTARGAGRYALGRGYLALGDDDRALAELQAAWDGGNHAPRTAYALALAEGHHYQRALREAERLPRELRGSRLRAIEARYRDPARAHLTASAGADVPSRDYVQALIAFYEDRYDDALAHLDAIDRSASGLSWFHEAPLLRGQILHARAMARRGQSTPEQIAADLEAGRRALATADAIGRSDPAVRIAAGDLEYGALVIEMYGAGAVDGPYQRGVAAVTAALGLVPDDVDALTARARLQRALAEFRGTRGVDVADLLGGAVADAQRAVALTSGRREALLELASCYRQWGEWRQGRSQDPAEQLQQAAEITARIVLTERDPEVDVNLGLIHKIWADYEDEVGRDASEHRRLAIDAYERALAIDDHLGGVWLNLGINYTQRGRRVGNPNADVDLGRAADALERGRELQPGSIVPYFYLGEVHAVRAGFLAAAGRDPRVESEQAIASYRRGLEINPGVPQLHNGISIVLTTQARAASPGGADPTELLADAADAANRAIEAAPDQGFGYMNLGDAFLARATDEQRRGLDPRMTADRARAAFREALVRLHDQPDLLLNLVELDALLAEHAAAHGRDPTADLDAARRGLTRALAVNPTAMRVTALRAAIDATAARWNARRAQGG